MRVLGEGELTKKLTIKAHHFTKSAAEKITAKGGTMEVIPPPKKPVRNKMKPRPPKPSNEPKRFMVWRETRSQEPSGKGGSRGEDSRVSPPHHLCFFS